jgi:hypothetical protein
MTGAEEPEHIPDLSLLEVRQAIRIELGLSSSPGPGEVQLQTKRDRAHEAGIGY